MQQINQSKNGLNDNSHNISPGKFRASVFRIGWTLLSQALGLSIFFADVSPHGCMMAAIASETTCKQDNAQ